jgi:para-nitrobenzyl esterase
MPWISVIDGDLLSQPILEAVRAGHGSNIPVLVGTTENEFAWIAIRENRGSEAARKKGQDFVDAFFRRPLNDFAEARKDAAAPTYRYEFQWKSESDPVVIGSGHSIDIPFFFNTLDAPYIHPYTGSNPPQKIADAMHGSFARFALTGDPGWPAYSDESDDAVMIFDNESRVVSGLTFD